MGMDVEFSKPSQLQTINAIERLNIIRPPRIETGTLGAANAQLLIDVRGEECANIYIQSTAFIGTIEFTASVDGVNFFPVPAYPYTIACIGGTLPVSGTPVISDGLVAANTSRCFTIPCGQIATLRVRVSAYTSGSCVATWHADGNDAINQSAIAKPSTFTVTATAAVGLGATATLPAAAGFRHIIDFIEVTRTASAALVVGAGVTLCTTTNIPGAPTLPFGQSADAQGVDKVVRRDFGGSGLSATTTNTATTVVCPATTGVIWTAIIGYRLGV